MLTPTERVLIVLRAWKRRTQPDDAVYRMSSKDRREFGGLIALAVAANQEFPYILLLQEYVAVLEQRYVLLSTQRILGDDIRALGSWIRVSTKEPVTESEYRRREEALRSALVPVSDLVEIAIEGYALWTDADYAGAGDEQVLSAEAQTRAWSETERELVRLFRAGALPGEERQNCVFIRAEAFYDWFGEALPILAESGDAYEIFPDSQAEYVSEQQRARRVFEQLVAGAPGGGDLPHDLKARAPDSVNTDVLERTEVADLCSGIRGRWCDLRAYEIVFEGFAAKEFNGHDPLRVEMRAVLSEIKRRLLALREDVQVYAGDIELTEPDPDDVSRLRESIRRHATRT